MPSATIKTEKGDEIALMYLGAAVVLSWQDLPPPVQQAILDQSSAVGGLPGTIGLHEQVQALIRRNQGGH